MAFASVLSFAHMLIRGTVLPGEPVVDATVGSGTDTLFLAELTGTLGVVYGIDIQEESLRRARERLDCAESPCAGVRLILGSHSQMEQLLPADAHGRLAAVMFNLGYLPGAGHAVITRPDSTIPALDASLRWLRPGGVLTVVLYTGHPGGPEEAEAVESWAAGLPQDRFQSLRYQFVNQANHPPFLLAVSKR